MSIRIAILCLLLMTVPCSARDWVVRPDGTGDAPTIAAALDSCLLDDEIVLADGVFIGTGNRDIFSYGRLFVLRSQSGDPRACVIDLQGSFEEPHFAFEFVEDG
jgi:hypothetical protein